MAATLNSGCRSTSARVDSPIPEAGVVGNVGVAGAISFAAVLQTEISCMYANCKAFPVFRPPYWISGR